MSDIESLQRDQQIAETPDEAFRAQLDGVLKNLHTCMPGTIVSFDAARQTCEVQPSVQRVFEGVATNLPLLVDCPVVFPQGGGFALTFPLAAGDEVLVTFAERSIDNWYQAGGQKPPNEYRMHDLSDGFVIPGINNQTRNLGGVDTARVALRTRAGGTHLTLAANGEAKITAGSSILTMTAAGAVTIDAPGGYTINGAGQLNGDVNCTGTITAATDVIGGGKSLKNHKHGGVQIGAAQTTPPV